MFLFLFIGFTCLMMSLMKNTIWTAANYITIYMFFFVLQIDMLIDDHKSSRKQFYFSNYGVKPFTYVMSCFFAHYVMYALAAFTEAFYVLYLLLVQGNNDYSVIPPLMGKYFFTGLSQTPLLYLLSQIFRNNESSPHSLIIIFILFFGHQFLIVY